VELSDKTHLLTMLRPVYITQLPDFDDIVIDRKNVNSIRVMGIEIDDIESMVSLFDLRLINSELRVCGNVLENPGLRVGFTSNRTMIKFWHDDYPHWICLIRSSKKIQSITFH
jgi:hypothetical protein